MVRQVGVEEELLLVDPATGRAAPLAGQVLKRLQDLRRTGPEQASDEVEGELFQHQVETHTDPATGLDDVRDQLRAARRTAGEAARDSELAAVACGVVPRPSGDALVSREDRYLDIVERYGEVARAMGTCGMHVHVEISSPEEGVAAVDALAPWVPLLIALGANSPFADDRDTGYASWRAQVWSRWPSAGPTERFETLERYREQCRWVLDSGAARDEKMLYLDVRLAADQPTVEVRVTDVCTDPEDALVVAALARGLVETANRTSEPLTPPWRTEMLRAAQWRASRYGATDRLLHPRSAQLAPAREVLGALLETTREALAEAGDLDLVTAGLERAVAGGGASRQRAALARTGSMQGVLLDLVARTEASWSDPGAR